MKRAAVVVLGASFVLVLGCGTQSYETRLEKTLDNRKYQGRLNDNLGDAATKGKLEQLEIYVRPPKSMTGPTQTFQLTVVEPGKFDVESSFIEPEKQSLHILARVKQAKTPSKKAPAKAETPRGEFNADIVELLKNVYGDEKIDLSKFKSEDKFEHTNYTFKSYEVDLNVKTVQVFLYGSKNDPHEVALIFEYPKAERNAVSPKIKLCLESFAVGDKAKKAFGGETEDTEATGEEAAPADTF